LTDYAIAVAKLSPVTVHQLRCFIFWFQDSTGDVFMLLWQQITVGNHETSSRTVWGRGA